MFLKNRLSSPYELPSFPTVLLFLERTRGRWQTRGCLGNPRGPLLVAQGLGVPGAGERRSEHAASAVRLCLVSVGVGGSAGGVSGPDRRVTVAGLGLLSPSPGDDYILPVLSPPCSFETGLHPPPRPTQREWCVAGRLPPRASPASGGLGQGRAASWPGRPERGCGWGQRRRGPACSEVRVALPALAGRPQQAVPAGSQDAWVVSEPVRGCGVGGEDPCPFRGVGVPWLCREAPGLSIQPLRRDSMPV